MVAKKNHSDKGVNVTNVAKAGNELYPVFLKLNELNTLLVGAGNVGLEKLNSVLFNSPKARVTVVAPEIKEEVRVLLSGYPLCKIIQRPFEEIDLMGKHLVILATDNNALHRSIRGLAKDKRILLNAADTPELCDFYLGSIVKKGNLKIAISTNGKSPKVAKRLKEVINNLVPEEIDELLKSLEIIRKKMDGNFEEKVKQLNRLTKILVGE